jgi:hypothetical protein
VTLHSTDPKDFRRAVITIAVVVTTFVIFKQIYRFPFIADDYRYLALRESGRLELEIFGKYIARLPLWSMLTYGLFESGLVYLETLSYTVVFFVHALMLMLISLRLRKKILPGEEELPWTFFLLVGIFCFFPNHHEILYWPTCWAYVAGLPLLYFGWCAQAVWLKILLYLLSFCCGEMYMFPALSLELMNVIVPTANSPDRRREAFVASLTWIVTVVIFLGLRHTLALFFGAYEHSINLNPLRMPIQFGHLLDHFFVMSFYKTFWLPTLLYWSAVGAAFTLAVRKGILQSSYFARGLVFITISGSLVFVMGYFAERALYGADLCVNALMIVYLNHALRSASVRIKGATMGLIAISFFGLTLMIYDLKSTNAKVLNEKAVAVTAFLRNCSEPCTVAPAEISQGLVRGWVLHEDYAADFIAWINAKERINKVILFAAPTPNEN